MSDTCLVTGGAGFIGCALSTALATRFERVVVLDNLHRQVHATPERPAALDARVELVRGDVTEPRDWDAVLSHVRPRTVVHLAAETGTGQSLTDASRHACVNVVGTAQMLDALTRHDVRPDRIVLASSRAVYGEGPWRDPSGAVCYPGQRSHRMLASARWAFPGLTPVPATAATTTPDPTSVYGATKLAQEHVLRAWCLSMDVGAVVLRLQNVYGPGQSLANPYTGIVSLFVQYARAGEAIPVFEDGRIVRDFVFVDDVVRALLAALDAPTGRHAIDIGSGRPTTVAELAAMIASRYAAPQPRVTGQYRDGDVRFACCGTQQARDALGWEPAVTLDEGVGRVCAWVGQVSDVR